MYATNADIASYLNITLETDGQTLVDSLIANYSKVIDNYCNRTWTNSNPLTEYFDAGTDTFFVSQPTITSITSVTVGGVPIDSANIFNRKTHVKIYQLPQVWVFPILSPIQAVKIIYTTDATAAPLDVKQALIRWVAEEFQKSGDGGRDVGKVQTGSVSVEYATMRSQPMPAMPSFVKLVLDNYRLNPIDHF